MAHDAPNKSMGRVDWIGLRVDRQQPMKVVNEAHVEQVNGLVDDRFHGGAEHRQVTLFQMEHLDTIARFIGTSRIEPHQTRRNIGVSGVNLHSLIDSHITIGDCLLKITGDCPPCERMETTIGPGGKAAMSGLGGVTATVVQAGAIKVGDCVKPYDA